MKKLLLIIIAGMGFYILYGGLGILKQSHDALSWPQVKGDVVSSTLTINHLPPFLNRGADPLRWYGVDVQYEYTVGDERFSSDRISFKNGDTRNPREALRVMNKYRRHPKVVVYYNPNDYQQSVLEPGDTGDLFIPLLVGVLLVFFGLSNLFGQSIEVRNEIDSRLQQGNIYQFQGKIEEALWNYNDIIRMNPYLDVGYISRGNLYLQEEDWKLAILDYTRALMISPKNAVVYYSLGKAYLGNKDYDKAFESMKKAQELGFHVKPEIFKEIRKNG